MVNKERMLDEYRTLVSFDSESFHEKIIAAYMYDRLSELGLSVSSDDAGSLLSAGEDSAGNIYGFLKGNAKGEPILLAAHMDTVAPGRGKKLVRHADGRLTSDGTTVLGADDVSGLCVILETLSVIKANCLPHPDIEVVFFVAEEPYCRGSAVFDYSKVRSKYAYVFDLDKEIGTIAISAPTILQFKAEFKGVSAHAGFEPEKGVSAIAAAARAVTKIRTGRLDDSTTANIGLFNGGTGKNVVPGSAVVEGEVRSSSDERAREVAASIGRAFREAAEEEGANVVFSTQKMIKAYSLSPDSEVVKRYERAVKEAGISHFCTVPTFGGSDANSLNEHGIDAVVVSNAMHNVHTTLEYLWEDELVSCAEIAVKLGTGAF